MRCFRWPCARIVASQARRVRNSRRCVCVCMPTPFAIICSLAMKPRNPNSGHQTTKDSPYPPSNNGNWQKAFGEPISLWGSSMSAQSVSPAARPWEPRHFLGSSPKLFRQREPLQKTGGRGKRGFGTRRGPKPAQPKQLACVRSGPRAGGISGGSSLYLARESGVVFELG